jgi:ParB-like chromosome segregation protein Spo0J
MSEESIGSFFPIEQLKEWEENPRHNQAAINSVAKSIQRFGFASPIIARLEDKQIIAGHTRYQAALKLGLKKVPVRFLDLDPVDSQLLAIADNKIGEKADWDEDLLSDLLIKLKEEDGQDLGILGFDDSELKELLSINEEELENFAEDNLDFVYQIIIEDLTEETQFELAQKLESEGYRCRLLTV